MVSSISSRPIAGMISTKSGVKGVTVNLKEKKGTVQYFENIVTPEEIALQVEDMGFDAWIKMVNGKEVEKGKFYI